MIQFSLLRIGAWARVALLFVVIAAGLGIRPNAAWATHIRAGDIQAKIDTTSPGNPRRVFFKLTLYTDAASGIDEEHETVFFGDGTSSCVGGITRLAGGPRSIPGNTDTKLNIYYFEHTYPSAGQFTVQFIGENRVDGVLNMDRSVDLSFYISTTFTLDPALGRNHSPVLRAPAIDKAGLNQVFLHNPAAYDADGDSLAFVLQPCQYNPQLAGSVVGPPCVPGTGNNTPTPQVCTNYRLPNSPSVTAANNPPIQVTYGGVPPGVPGAAAIFVMDVRTGQITWNAPVAVGKYNVAFRVEEWRRTPLGRTHIGDVVRDMQIIVSATNNLPPVITIPADICVIAGQPVTGAVTAVDGVAPGSTEQTPISLFAYSGILPPATFTQSATGPPTARGTFNWQTDCSNVAQQPYLVVFKAQDSPNPVTPTNPILIDEKTWRITVVGPAPQNLRVTANNAQINTATLNWNTYQCANASRIYIYRKVNTSSFVPGPCDTGIPASAGYTRIGSVAANVTTFIDSNVSANGTALGLDRGQTYCYRIYAEFPLPAGGASIASAEACASFTGTSVKIVKVDVENTGVSNGQMQVCWTRPRTAAGTVLDGTPSYVLSRGEGPTPTAFTPVATLTSPTDTCYTDTNINTQDLQYTYKVEFVRTFPAGSNQAPIREAAPTASSVRVNAVPANAAASAVTVTWTYNVPWDNTTRPAVIFRNTGGPTGFVRIGTAPTTATGGTYTDSDPNLRKGQTYCYYVLTEGQYVGITYLSSLLNRSQQRCLVLTSPPCTPVLALQATNCDSLAALQEFPGLNQRYANYLRWNLSNLPTGCDATIASYRVYYRPAPTGRFTLLATTTQTSYVHRDLAFSGGCYAVQAVAPSGVLSDTSNVACQDNCVFFKLPNIFTPNGDNQNAVFRPKNNSPVRSVHFQAFNRWGVQVFENTTTADSPVLINWDGGGPVGETGNGSSGKVSDGLYYFLAEVQFADFANTRRTYKGWVEIVR